MINTSYGVPTDAAYGGEPQLVQTPYGLVRNDASYKAYLAEKERKNGLMPNGNIQSVNENSSQLSTDFGGSSSYTNDRLGPSSNVSTNQICQQPQYWETVAKGQEVYNCIQQQEGDAFSKPQNLIDYSLNAVGAGVGLGLDYLRLRNQKMTDKYKHALLNCNAAQNGEGGVDMAKYFSNLKEGWDIRQDNNTPDASRADQYANQIGRFLGQKYPNENCEDLVQKYIKKRH